jgi:outer membrane protein OmpA-like peptidoglycan-associated protein
MKKIWPWLLLLLLLILFCVWAKKDSIHISSKTPSTVTTAPIHLTEKHSIDYIITQKENNYVLSGNFTNNKQQASLADTFTAASSVLSIKGTTTNATLVEDGTLALTNKILPHFIKNYTNGKITYQDNKLSIYGNTKSYKAQHEMQRLLNSSMLASQDNTNVIVEKPIHFNISKTLDKINFRGTFDNQNQIDTLRSKLPTTTNTSVTKIAYHIDKGAVSAVSMIIPSFVAKYTEGEISYTEEMLTVSGMVDSQEDLDFMNQLLSKSDMPIVNHTHINPAALAKAKAAKEAMLAKVKADEVARLVKLKADEAAKLAAEEKLREEANKKAQALKDIEEAKIKAKEAADAAKAKITKLLQIENIEFEVAKGSLTPRGKATVDKLANILTQYPNIKAEIAGHTDSDGSAEFNQKLSQARVDTAKQRLISKGISAARLTAKGYGESQPLVPNTSDVNKQRNRRVEINIQGE